jgi:hypothetical protein
VTKKPEVLFTMPLKDAIDAQVVEMTGKPKQEGICPTCGKPIDMATFTDPLSVKEYRISGMCQACQDAFFRYRRQLLY